MIKKLSIIIPVLNEEATLEKILGQVIQAPVFGYQKEIIIVDDGSTDGTGEILDKMKKKEAKKEARLPKKKPGFQKKKPGFQISNFQNLQIKILRHQKSQGKGAALRTALKKATGQAVIIQDADLEYDPNDYQKLLAVFNKTGAVVYGSRNINPKKRGYYHYALGAGVLTKVNNLFFKSKLTDICTCYKLFPTDLIKSINLKSRGFEAEAEITAKILKRGNQIREVAISYNPRKFKEGKKIRPKDGLKMLWTTVKYRIWE